MISAELNRDENWRQIVESSSFQITNANEAVKGLPWGREIAIEVMSYGSYPLIDGSTVCVPMGIEFARQHLQMSDNDARDFSVFSTTARAYDLLISKDEIVRSLNNPRRGFWPQAVDLILVTEPSAAELSQAKKRGISLVIEPICWDAFVFITHKDNPVESLTLEQLRGIFSGKITNWAQVGGDDLEITAYQRVAQSGSQVMMEKQVMQGTEMMEAPSALRPGEMGELVDDIASYIDTPSAIGYSVYYYVNTMYMKENIRLMSVNGVAPTNEAIASGEYPYTQDFYAVIRADAALDSPERALYDWLGSEDAAELLTRMGYVPVITEEGYYMGYVTEGE